MKKLIDDLFKFLNKLSNYLSSPGADVEEAEELLKKTHSIAEQIFPRPEEVKHLPMNQPDSTLLDKMCDAIQEMEGYLAPGEHPKYPNGTRAWLNKNPGNLKFAKQVKAIGRDGAGFAKFRTYSDGREALMNMLRSAAQGRSKVYKPTMTLRQFFDVYAPAADHNFPAAYALFVQKRMGVEPSWQIKNLA